jgi:hypothetical protein
VNAQTARFFREYNLKSTLFVEVCFVTVAPTLWEGDLLESSYSKAHLSFGNDCELGEE